MAGPEPRAPRPARARPSYLQLLRQRSFGSLWTAQVISQSGDAVFDLALLWLVYVTTGSIALVGVTQAAILVPFVLAAPVAGVYADRLNRRNLMIASNVAKGLITAAFSVLYAVGLLHFPVLILLVLLLFSGAQFFRAASNAILPRIVRKEELAAANGLFTLSTSANQLVSYSVGGIVIAVVNQPIIVLVQTHVPGEILGRAITVMGSVLTAAQPIAAILSGTLAALSSIGAVFLGSGLAMIASTAIMYFAFPDLARARY